MRSLGWSSERCNLRPHAALALAGAVRFAYGGPLELQSDTRDQTPVARASGEASLSPSPWDSEARYDAAGI